MQGNEVAEGNQVRESRVNGVDGVEYILIPASLSLKGDPLVHLQLVAVGSLLLKANPS